MVVPSDLAIFYTSLSECEINFEGEYKQGAGQERPETRTQLVEDKDVVPAARQNTRQ
jgi:hypothetical protein